VDAFLRPQKEVLFTEINRWPDGDLLEIGVGNGNHLSLYKSHKVVGIDTSSAMLDLAKKQNRASIELLQMDGQGLLFPDEQFDYVVLSHVIAVVDSPERVLQEVFRVLKPKGKLFILNHFTPDNWLRHIDAAFGIISKMFCFRSVFHLDEIAMITKFALVKEIPFGPAAYFKLLIYQKK
jgi:phosphatidylethanolamine/phosphatidyl-N-methylethanolamine N-methyltransferase